LIDTTTKHFYEIVNYEYHNDDIFSYKLIEWYKEVVFFSIEDNLIKKLDDVIYLYITNKLFNKHLKNNINIKQININNLDLIDMLDNIKKDYINNYKLETSRWL